VILADILAINLRTEILNSAFAEKAAHECTAFFTNTILDGNGAKQMVLGQNWDWKPSTSKAIIILEVAPDHGPNFVTVVEAGLMAKMGMNAAGVSLATNALVTDLDQNQTGVPYHIILRAILESSSFEGAVDMMQHISRASAANYLLASQMGQVLDMEAGPGFGPDNLFPTPISSNYVHTNHFLCPTLPFVDVGLAQGPDSPIREERMLRFLQEAVNKPGVEALHLALSDHLNYPYSICCHPEEDKPIPEQYATLASIIMDLPARRFWLAGDNPCQTQYQLLDYSEFLAG
ncbi:MAG: C45 family peptidase, partial [Chloroflexota bacterium]